MPSITLATSPLDLEQARDLRRSVLCGELNWGREAVDDGADRGADVALGVESGKPVATGRLIPRQGRAWLDLLAVLPSRRRQGLGRAVSEFLRARARENGYAELWALAIPASALFFESLGFSVQGGESGVLLLRRSLD